MKNKEMLNKENDYFSSSLENGVLVVRQKQHILYLTQELGDSFSLYDYMDSLLSNKSYKAFVMFVRSQQISQIEYSCFLSKVLSGKWESTELERYHCCPVKFGLMTATD
jgi:hypothetical protein